MGLVNVMGSSSSQGTATVIVGCSLRVLLLVLVRWWLNLVLLVYLFLLRKRLLYQCHRLGCILIL